MSELLHEAVVKERKLNLLYAALLKLDGLEPEESGFYERAKDEQDGGLELLQEISEKYCREQIDPNILEKLGESLLQLKSGHTDYEELLRKVLDFESELVEAYKQSLRFLTADDRTRKQVNRILTVKLTHKRDLLDKLGSLAG
ncbi:MAG: ferritin-like domain-containing protein [bacterium]